MKSITPITSQEALEIYKAGPEAVVKIICQLSEFVVKIDELKEENEQLKARVQELENRLAQNSRNSSKPPSSDGFKRPMTQSLREKTGRKPGGQPGHEGHTLKIVDNPQHIKCLKVEGVCEC